jgi:hypothetical protein
MVLPLGVASLIADEPCGVGVCIEQLVGQGDQSGRSLACRVGGQPG